jgi:hypothetical protein
MPDFGIFRGFSDKLFQGQTPTQLGKIGAYDIDAESFFNRVTNAGGALSDTEKNAINLLVLDLKNYSIWTKIKAIYPMVGASSSACSQNLKSSSFTSTFSSGWTFSSTGATPNGTSAFMNTGILGNTDLTGSSSGIGMYSGTNATSAGAYGTGGNFHIYPRFNDSNTYYRPLNAGGVSTNNGTSLGLTHQYTDGTNGHAFFNGTKKGTSVINGTMESANLFFGGQRPSVANYDNKQIRFAFASLYLTDAEAANFYTAVQAFQTTLSRQV